MRSRGGIFGFSVLEFGLIVFAVIYNRFIIRLLHKAITGGFGDNPTLFGFGTDGRDQQSGNLSNDMYKQLHDNIEQYYPNWTAPGNKNRNKVIALNQVADTMLKLMSGVNWFGCFKDIKDLSSGLTAQEMEVVAYSFSRPDRVVWGVTLEKSLTLFQWFEAEFDKKQQLELKQIWAKSNLWR